MPIDLSDPQYLIPAVAAGAFMLGALLVWLISRGRIVAALERSKSESMVELAQLRERLTIRDREHEGLTKNAAEWEEKAAAFRNASDALREERAKLEVHVATIPELMRRIEECKKFLSTAHDDLLRISTSEAEKAEGLENARARIQEMETITQAQKTDLDRLQSAFNQELGQRVALEGQASRIPDLNKRLSQTEETSACLQQDLSQYREKAGRLETDLQALQKRHEEVKNVASVVEADRDSLRNDYQRSNTERAELKITLDAERSQTKEKIALLNDAKEQLSSQFKNLANEILEEKSRRFTEQNHTNIGALLDPLREKIKEFQIKVEDVYVKESKDRSALAEQVRQLMELNQHLSQDAKSLTRALKGDRRTQGLWGELVLERVLESAGLRNGEEYQTQESHTREDGGRSQPDVVIRLPENKHLVVDAKVSLTAYERYTTADTDGERDIERKRHIESIRNHIKVLSEKNYQALYGLKQLDFVLMFVAVEPAFMLAVTEDRELFMDAWQKNVLLVSPSTLLFVVRTVAHLWRQEQQNKNAQEIAKRGAELYDKLTGFSADLERLGERLNQARESYEGAVNKLAKGRGNVIRQAEMLRELGVKPSKSISGGLLELSQLDDEMTIAAA